MTSNQCYTWDFRMNVDDVQPENLINALKQLSKHYIFQMEKGHETGYLHYQGRFSLIKKSYKKQLMSLWAGITEIPVPNFLEPTVNPPKVFDYNCYAGKADSRVGETYTDKDEDKEPIYIPRQYRNKIDKLRPFQKVILDSANIFEERIINLIYDDKGCHGKSVVAALAELLHKGIDLPPVNDADQLIQSCCNICMDLNVRDPSPIFIDLPRAMNKERLNGIYTAIEQIKKGKLYDMRYKYKAYWIDSPQIWVFTNIEPDIRMLSSDRWKLWMISDDYELVSYNPLSCLDE